MSKVWLACCFLIPALLRAEEVTVAWRFAVSPVPSLLEAGAPLEWLSSSSAALPILESPPGETSFVTRGDRLIDLSSGFKSLSPRPGGLWVVWNETRHLLIAHGDLETLESVQQVSAFESQPKTLVITVRWYQDVDPSAIPAGAKPVREIVMRTRGEADLESEWRGPTGEIKDALPWIRVTAKVDMTEGTNQSVWIYALNWTERKDGVDLSWSANSAGSLTDQAPEELLLHTTSPSGVAWTVTASARTELLDGTLLRETRSVEKGGRVEKLPVWTRDSFNDPEGRVATSVGDQKLMVADYVFSLSENGNDAEIPPGPDADPFAPEKPKDVKEKPIERLKEAMLPPELQGGVPLGMLGIRSKFAGWGIVLGDGDFAGYSPLDHHVRIATASHEALDRLENLICFGHPSILNFQVGLRLAGQETTCAMILAARSGQRAVLKCVSDGEEKQRWSIEPTSDATRRWIDLPHEWSVPPLDGRPTIRGKGGVLLMTNREMEVQSWGSAGAKTSLMLKAELAPISGKAPR